MPGFPSAGNLFWIRSKGLTDIMHTVCAPMFAEYARRALVNALWRRHLFQRLIPRAFLHWRGRSAWAQRKRHARWMGDVPLLRRSLLNWRQGIIEGSVQCRSEIARKYARRRTEMEQVHAQRQNEQFQMQKETEAQRFWDEETRRRNVMRDSADHSIREAIDARKRISKWSIERVQAQDEALKLADVARSAVNDHLYVPEEHADGAAASVADAEMLEKNKIEIMYNALTRAFGWMDEANTWFNVGIFFRQLKFIHQAAKCSRIFVKKKLKKYLLICYRLIQLDRCAPLYRRMRMKMGAFRK